MATQRSFKPKLHIILDLETTGIHSTSGITEIAAICQAGTSGELSRFSVMINPASYESNSSFRIDPNTILWHEQQNPGIGEEWKAKGTTWMNATVQFAEWLNDLAHGGSYEIHYWSQGKDFDFPILSNHFEKVGLTDPWKFRQVHCLRDLVWLNPRSRLKETADRKGHHRAINDAEWALRQFQQVYADSTWYQKLFR